MIQHSWFHCDVFIYVCRRYFGYINPSDHFIPAAQSFHIFPLPSDMPSTFMVAFYISVIQWLHLGLFIEAWVRSYLQKHGPLTSDNSSEHSVSPGPGPLIN